MVSPPAVGRIWALRMVIDGGNVDVGPGDTVFLPNLQPHDHENRAAVPFAIALALVVVGWKGLAQLEG